MNRSSLGPPRSHSFDLFTKVNFADAFYSFLYPYVFRKHIRFSKSNLEADSKALKGDWETVGLDFANAMKEFDEAYCR